MRGGRPALGVGAAGTMTYQRSPLRMRVRMKSNFFMDGSFPRMFISFYSNST
jgi:hypothetical protein